MIKRLNKTTLVELTKTTKTKASWRIIITDRATRDLFLSTTDLNKIQKWQQQLLASE